MLLGSVAQAEITAVDAVVIEALQKTPDRDNGKRLYYACAVCHTPEGWGSPSGYYPQIAGQHRSVLLKQLADIYKGNRDNPTMSPFTTSLFKLGSQALADLAAYIEALPMVPNNSLGMGGDGLVSGKKLYEDNCQNCHEANGEGKAAEFYPRIHGQHFRYLQRQMVWIKNGKRRNSDKEMVEQVHNFSYADIDAVSDYVSRMKPEQSRLADHLDWRNPDFRAGFKTVPRE
ncbi:MAG: c-type cytochrome [Gammaproteobacteria bacterium]|nr:c-type cytochrome [Gammaproteobacteria bacterium]